MKNNYFNLYFKNKFYFIFERKVIEIFFFDFLVELSKLVFLDEFNSDLFYKNKYLEKIIKNINISINNSNNTLNIDINNLNNRILSFINLKASNLSIPKK